MTEDLAQRIKAVFSEAEREELDGYRYRINDEKSIGTLDLLVSWALHVQKIDEDRAKPATDRHVWGAHDLIAAVSLRSFLARCLDRLPEPLEGKVAGQLARYDEHFVAITREDDGRLLEQVAEEDLSGKPWWWHRIPDSGPIADELRGYA